MNQHPAQEQWFAVHVRTRYEKTASSILEEKGYPVFLPLQVTRRKWSDRNKQIETPLFAGYVFCRFDPAVRLPILTTCGVIGIVGGPEGPIALPQTEIDGIRTIVDAAKETEVVPFMPTGQKVVVTCGSLSGVEGVVISVKGRYRIVVSVSLLGRSVLTEIDMDCVRELEDERIVGASRVNSQRLFAGNPLLTHQVHA